MPHYNNIIIYYFSGTGNSKNAARWLENSAASKNIATTAIDIAKTERRNL